MSSQLTLYRRPSTKHTLIVWYLGRSVKDYCENFLHQLDIWQLLCPACQQAHTLTRHGSYCRHLIWGDTRERMTILRVLCGKCKKTHAILPDFVDPQRIFAMPVVESAVEAVLDQKVAVEKVDGPQDVSTIKRWCRRFRSYWREIYGALHSIVARATDINLSIAAVEEDAYLKKLQALWDHLPAVLCTSSFGRANIFLTADQTQVWV
jgi:hypothetical protein